MPNMDYELYMDTAVLAGKIMLESNAETYRVEETVTRILNLTELKMIDALALTTGLIATLDSPEMDAITVVKRISVRSTNLGNITRVNDISRRVTSGVITIEEAYKQLNDINGKTYNELFQSIALIGFIQAIAIMYQGGWTEFTALIPISIAVAFIRYYGGRWRVTSFIIDMVASFFIALLTYFIGTSVSVPISQDIMIISAIMPLLPGTAMTNGVRDIFRGDYMSGGAKILEAFLIAVFVAMGIGFGLVLGGRLFG
ncbi:MULTISPECIES: threonine/serine ThrE exporter family protein [unclassified Jeotgalibaca]|uniref:threonine/serine ThrE exporter family protein n=1 Tax=unclassified Jeotgalibaca TaxID=2621505 RepID=UPI003FD19015